MRTVSQNNMGINGLLTLSCYFNNVILCSIVLKQEVQYTQNKESALLIVSIFPIYSQKYENLSDLDLEVIWRIKLFLFKRHCTCLCKD